ncbi:MAG: hypothetical protein ABIW82_04665 [Dokdonella sp.]
MKRLRVLTRDHARLEVDDTIVVQRGDGKAETFHFVSELDNLLRYRHENVSDDEPRKLIA